jgi:hypothetical protein
MKEMLSAALPFARFGRPANKQCVWNLDIIFVLVFCLLSWFALIAGLLSVL